MTSYSEVMESMAHAAIGRALVRKGVLSSDDIVKEINLLQKEISELNDPLVKSDTDKMVAKLIEAIRGWETAALR